MTHPGDEPLPPAGGGSRAAVRVALDLLGGDDAPAAVAAGALLAADADPTLDITLVGPPDVAADCLAAAGAQREFPVVPARQVVGMASEPARAVRAAPDATVRVAARLVRDGAVDAAVSVGSTGAAVAAAVFTLGRLPGATRPALAAVLPALAGPVVLLDVGAGTEASAEQLARFAVAGAAYARARLGLSRPRVGLLSLGAEPGKGDGVRRTAYDLLASALDPAAVDADFVGNVEGGDVALGGRADVVVTDGFTGNVLLKGLEASAALVSGTARARLGGHPGAPAAELDPLSGPPASEPGAEATVLAALDAAVWALSAEATGGAVLLGVPGVCVVGHGAATPPAVAACLATAARTVRDGVVDRVGAALGELVGRRRTAAGLGSGPATPP